MDRHQGGGLNRFDKKYQKFKKYGKEQGLPDNVVYGILSEEKNKNGSTCSNIWMSTNKGLCRFDVRAETVKNFTVKDGLQDNEFNGNGYLKTRDGHFIFCGINGINLFHPEKLHFNDNLPQIQIVGLKVNNKSVKLDGSSSIELAADQNLLNFEFAALEFTNPSQNQYRYQLTGIDKSWVDLGYKNNIQFANLAPGDYTFRVLGSNNDGIWGLEPAELKFTINSPWYATWWAYLFYALMLAIIVRYLYTYKLRQDLKHQETEKLREMDDFKSRFFTNITHEFRTPLTVILGMSDQLARFQKDQHQIKNIELIKRNGENLLRLVNQILDLSKLESNTLKLNYTRGDVLAYLKYITESLHSMANAQNLLLRVESDQAKIEMDYDADRLLQIMYNLLSNAIKFTPSGGKVVVRADQKDNWLHISVTDTGAGIAEHELPYLFERFFQARNQEYSKAGGTGIGLSLTNELVKAMGGEIQVDSKVGIGTKFLLKLPVTHTGPKSQSIDFHVFEDQKALGSFRGTANSTDWPANQQQPERSSLPHILLIEDNPDVVEYLTICLSQNFQLDFAFNGQAGIEKALEAIPDIIISDVMMPIKDGFDVLEALKFDERTSHVPIILLTARADIQSRLEGLKKGADAYLAKPFHQEELTVTVENLLESRRQLQLKYQQNNWIIPESKEIPLADIEDVFLQKFRAVVEQNISNSDFEMPQLEKVLSMSRSQIYRKIKALTDKSPSMLIRSIRLRQGRHLLLTTQLTVSEIAYEVGYTAISNFSDAYLEEFGERPLKTRG
ncbi:MAG: response regulator [Saprospiraceae bacterium]|nr:response regulator [Saprospiraceae bacterium]